MMMIVIVHLWGGFGKQGYWMAGRKEEEYLGMVSVLFFGRCGCLHLVFIPLYCDSFSSDLWPRFFKYFWVMILFKKIQSCEVENFSTLWVPSQHFSKAFCRKLIQVFFSVLLKFPMQKKKRKKKNFQINMKVARWPDLLVPFCLYAD